MKNDIGEVSASIRDLYDRNMWYAINNDAVRPFLLRGKAKLPSELSTPQIMLFREDTDWLPNWGPYDDDNNNDQKE